MAAGKRYKPVDRKVRPVSTYMPNPSAQKFRPINIPVPPIISHHPPPSSALSLDGRLTRERLDDILGRIPSNFLWPQELDLMASVLHQFQDTLAWSDNERGTLSREIFPDYVVPYIEHTPWMREPIRIPKAAEPEVRRLLHEQIDAGKYEYSAASYRSRIFPVLKKSNKLRLVLDLQDLNAITVRDAALPPRPDDFAESFVGHAIYGVADLFSGFDARTLAEESRDLTTFHSLVGPLRTSVLPQGFTNSMPEFQRCSLHALGKLVPLGYADVFIDDAGIKGPTSTYGNRAIDDNSGIRQFVFEYIERFAWTLAHFRAAGFTASGAKLIPAAPKVEIVGTVVSLDGLHLSHGIANKVLKWPVPRSVTDVRGFLGVAGVGRKWIYQFSLIAKPLTRLCRSADIPFHFDADALKAFEDLKSRIATAPVLRAIAYDKARSILPAPRASDDGLVILAVDSSIHGAGWILAQIHVVDRHPAFFGSCTFSRAESRYSQPKIELYGVFRAMKEMRYRIWGCHFRLEVDAISLKQMIKEPDLPNAPMTRWVSYIQQFDYDLQHVPATKGVAQDGLSRRGRADEDSDESDGEAELDAYLGAAASYTADSNALRLSIFRRNVLDTMRQRSRSGFDREVVIATEEVPHAALVSLGEFESLKGAVIKYWDHVHASEDPGARIWDANICNGEPRWVSQADEVLQENRGAQSGIPGIANAQLVGDEASDMDLVPFHPSLLRMEDDVSYSGREFLVRNLPVTFTSACLLGDEQVEFEFTEYRYAWAEEVNHHPALMGFTAALARISKAATPRAPGDTSHLLRSDHRMHCVPQVALPYEKRDLIPAIGHKQRVRELEQPGQWAAIRNFLRDGSLPSDVVGDAQRIVRFKVRASRYLLHDNRLWRRAKPVPRLVVEDQEQRIAHVAAAHNNCGHRGRDATFKHLQDRFYWPNMYEDVAWFVQSCNACQFRAKARPVEPLRLTLSPSILRKFSADTIVMGDGYGGMRYLLHVSCATSKWCEARAVQEHEHQLGAFSP